MFIETVLLFALQAETRKLLMATDVKLIYLSNVAPPVHDNNTRAWCAQEVIKGGYHLFPFLGFNIYDIMFL